MMKIIQILLLFSLGLFLSGCDKDEDSLAFDPTNLKQTKWAGTFEESFVGSTGTHVTLTATVGFFFISENEGRYSLKWKSSTQASEYAFTYTINEKIFTVKAEGSLEGSWSLSQFDKDQMILEKGTSGEDAYKGVLTLTRTY